MHPDRTVLSAYLDGEVAEPFATAIRESIDADPDVRRDYEELVELRERLTVEPSTSIDESMRRSWGVISARIEAGSGAPRLRPRGSQPVWRRAVALPLPALAAAALVVLALVGVLVWSLLPARPDAGEYLTRGNNVDVTIRVDGAEMEQVLQWLVDRNMLGEISIQLPEQQFQIVGEPVFVKPAADYPGEVVR